MFYFEEQNLEEIGKIMNINANNVKVKLFRSRQKLAVILKKQLEPEIVACYEIGKIPKQKQNKIRKLQGCV